MPLGYLLSLGVVAALLALAAMPAPVWRALRRPRRVGLAAWVLTMVVNESPFLAVYWLALATALAAIEGDLAGVATAAWGVLALACFLVSGSASAVLLARSLSAQAAFRDLGLVGACGVGGRAWIRIILAPLPLLAVDLARTTNIPYGPAGRANLLDVYSRRSRRAAPSPSGSPILIHFHGGGFNTGRKSFEARPLLHGLARRGWVCISANYRLHPQARFPDFLVDATRVISWAREHAGALGADPNKIVVAGSSAGAHLAVTSALTVNEGVAAAVGLYGWYGRADAPGSEPLAHVRAGGPPLLVVHGEHDTYVAVEHAREFVRAARAAGLDRLDYVELRGGQHSFDLLHSVRFEAVVSAVAAFAERSFRERRSLPGTPSAPSPPEGPGPRGRR